MRPGSRLGSAQDNYFENNLVYAGTYNSWIYNFVKSSTSYRPRRRHSIGIFTIPPRCRPMSRSLQRACSWVRRSSQYSGNTIATGRCAVSPLREEERRLRTTQAQPRLRSRDSGIESKVCGGLPQGRGTTNSKKLLNW